MTAPRFTAQGAAAPYIALEQRVLSLMAALAEPVLRTHLEYWTGQDCGLAIDRLANVKLIQAAFPEAVAGDSGRQFWRLNPDAPIPSPSVTREGGE